MANTVYLSCIWLAEPTDYGRTKVAEPGLMSSTDWLCTNFNQINLTLSKIQVTASSKKYM